MKSFFPLHDDDELEDLVQSEPLCTEISYRVCLIRSFPLAQELIWGRLGLVFVYPMRAVLYGMTLRPWGILIELKKLTEQPLQVRITALHHYS